MSRFKCTNFIRNCNNRKMRCDFLKCKYNFFKWIKYLVNIKLFRNKSNKICYRIIYNKYNSLFRFRLALKIEFQINLFTTILSNFEILQKERFS